LKSRRDDSDSIASEGKMKTTGSGDKIVAAMKRRGVRRLAYFHTDHFEPWRSVPGRGSELSRGVDDVERFARQCDQLDYARRSSLFVKSNVAVDSSRDLHRASPEDQLGFVPRDEVSRALGKAFMAPLTELGMELQVHIHHENFIWNGNLKDQSTRDYLVTPLGKMLGPARLELAVRLNLEMLREDAGIPLDRWFFIHGHWALNASDPGECTVVREIELLMRNGCLGDFTQPAGRPHVDSRVCEPYLVSPSPQAKGYDGKAARPIAAAGGGDMASNRFFLWATTLAHTSASIDVYSKAVERRSAEPHQFGMAQAEDGVLIDGTLYVKTHGHSMTPTYWEEGGIPFPHAHPAIQRELNTLFEAASAAGADIAFLTCSEVYDEILGAKHDQTSDLIARWGLDHGDPMEDQGITLVHQDASGVTVEAPELPFRAPHLAPPGPAVEAVPESNAILPVIVSLDRALAEPDQDSGNSRGSYLPFGASVQRINELASARVREIIEKGEAEHFGISGFYITRAREAAILQRSERLVAEHVLQRFGKGAEAWEIGCGPGVLTSLLAANGVVAIGVDRNPGRLRLAMDIADKCDQTECPSRIRPRFVEGIFPRIIEQEQGLSQSVAILTNLLGSADIPAQRYFVRGLRRFGFVIIDLTRFFTRRTTQEEQGALIDLFRAEGFSSPEMLFDLGSDGNYALFGKAKIGVRFTRQNRRIWADRLRARFAG
jgi:hypothetical protein